MGINDPLTELSLVRTQRRDLDERERRLIEAARAHNIGWARIAAALGLASRQAAEQRYLRLCGAASRDPATVRRQRSVDKIPAIADLRSAVVAALQSIEADPSWDSSHTRAILVRTSLLEASSAPPSAMFALVQNAVEDLATFPDSALSELRSAFEAAAET